jgi:hypothetical protein
MCRYCFSAFIVFLAAFILAMQAFGSFFGVLISNPQYEEVRSLQPSSDFTQTLYLIHHYTDKVLLYLPSQLRVDLLSSPAGVVALMAILFAAVPALLILLVHFFRHLSDPQDHPMPKVVNLPAEQVGPIVERELTCNPYVYERDLYQTWWVLEPAGNPRGVALKARFSFTAAHTATIHFPVHERHTNLQTLCLWLELRVRAIDAGRCEVQLHFRTPATAFYDNGRSIVRATTRNIFRALNER